MSSDRTQGSVLVVGAGMAGLSCARVLHEAGRQVTVVDKSRGLGGRMSTRRGDDWQADHGAQYFTARDADFINEVTRWQSAGVAALWKPRLAVAGSRRAGEKMSSPPQRLVGVPRMTAPANWLADSLPIIRQAHVSGLKRTAQGWQAYDAQASAIAEPFDSVILALPRPQAMDLLPADAAELSVSEQDYPMQACWAVMVVFAGPLTLTADALFINEGPLSWAACDSSKPGRPAGNVWVLHATTEWSHAHLEQSPERVTAQLLTAFQTAASLNVLPPVLTMQAHRWRFARSEGTTSRPGYLWSESLNMGLCGDWLYGGRVEGAWLSGRRLAQHILKSSVPTE